MASGAKRPRVVIVGAGFGGINAARALAGRGVEILLIDRTNHHVFQPLLVAADLQRPAAIEQLKVIGQQLEIPVFSKADSDPVKVCQEALIEANRQGRDVIILDTAGRLHIDDA